MYRSPKARSRVLVLGALLVAGCSFEPAAVHPTSNECKSDGECASGRCEMESNRCISFVDEPLQIGLELTPATDAFGARPPTMTFGPVPVQGPRQWPDGADLPEPILVVGDVRAKETREDAGRPIRAEITFESPSAFEGGTPTRFVASTASEAMSTRAGPADYRVRVVAESRYDVTVRPTGDAVSQLPPLRFRDVSVPGGGDVWRLDITYGPSSSGLNAPAELDVLEGRIVSRDSVDARLPEDGLRVRAIEPATRRVVSSTAVTGEDGELGVFVLRLAPDADEYVLRITAGEDRPLFPTITADPRYFASPEIQQPDILVPRLAPVRYEGFVETEAMDPVPGAVVTFRSEDVFDDRTLITGSFRTSVSTLPEDDGERAGHFAADLLPGRYEVLVTPSDAQGSLGVFVDMIRIHQQDEPLRGQVLKVPGRAHFAGSVRSPEGAPVAGVTVVGRALGQDPLGEISAAARYNRDSTAVSDPSGSFDLPLDVGTYDVVIRPAASTGYPWLLQPDLTIGGADRNFGNNFDLFAPMPLRGVIRTPDGGVMAGAELKAFVLMDGDGSEGEQDDRVIQVARTNTAEDGSYELLIPPRVQR